MRWARPELLWGLAVLPLLALWVWYSGRRLRARWLKFTDEKLLPRHMAHRSSVKVGMKHVTWLLGIALCLAAAARPQYGASTVKQMRRGLDLVVLIDTSKSMLAKDLVPDRLSRAKLELSALLDQLHGDRVGFIAFAGQAFVQCPLTSDYSAAKVFLRALDTKTIPRGGTAIGEALKTAGGLLSEARLHGGSRSQVVFVMTDGEDHEADPIAAARELNEQGVSVFTIGVGSTAGEPVPMVDESTGKFLGYMKDKNGSTVLSRLNEDMLKKIAEAGGGRYVPSADGTTGVEQLIPDLASFERQERESKYKVVYADRFQWFLLPGVILLMLGTFLTNRRKNAAVAATLLGLLMLPADAFAMPVLTGKNDSVEDGNAALSSGNADEAIKAYDQAKAGLGHRPELWLNHGLALLKKGDPQNARPSLERALLSNEKDIRSRAHYLLGNAAFDLKDYKASIDAYKKALREVPSNKDAKYNLELAQRMQKQEDEKKKNEDKKDDQKNKDKQDKQDEQDKKDPQNQDKKDQQKSDQQKKQDQDSKQGEDKQKGDQDQEQQQKRSPELSDSELQKGEKEDKTDQERMQLLDSLKSQEKPLRFNIFQQQKQKRPTVEKDW